MIKLFKKKIIFPSLEVFKLSSFDEYKKFLFKNHEKIKKIEIFENNLIDNKKEYFTIPGICFVCRKKVNFLVDFKYCYEINGKKVPNWRERVVCPSCNLNNRLRATIHIFIQECKPELNSKIYITEQTTPIYKWLKNKFNNVIGSEYLGNSFPYGKINKYGIRNESLTELSFDNESFDFILSFDVLEHIPDYKKALKECYRCLKKNGIFLFTVPFIINSEKNIIRAYIKNGKIIHILSPEYHADPVNPKGCLCYYHFGWEILDDLKDAGFKESYVIIYWSKDYAYLGNFQVIFIAKK